MSMKIIAQNKDIPENFLVNQKIIKVHFFNSLTVFFLENGYDVYIHHDTGEMDLIKVDTN